MDDREVEELWKKLGPKLRNVATRFLGAGRPVEDSRHLANAAFHSLIRQIREGNIVDADRNKDLWQTVLKHGIGIVKNKTKQANRDQIAKKRGGGMKQADIEPQGKLADDPALIAEVEELLARLKAYAAKSNQKMLSEIIAMKLQGHTSKEIAAALDMSEPTVSRRIHELRRFISEQSSAN